MMKIKNNSGLMPCDPIKELTDEKFIGKAIVECLKNNDPEGAMEVIAIYVHAAGELVNATAAESRK